MADEDPGDDMEAQNQTDASDVSLVPSETADSAGIVESKIPSDIRERYDVISYKNAALILAESRKEEFDDIITALRNFRITTQMIRTAGGNESEIPKLISNTLRPLGWHETTIQGDLLVKMLWKEEVGKTKAGKLKFDKKSRELLRERYLDGHKID